MVREMKRVNSTMFVRIEQMTQMKDMMAIPVR